MNQIELKCVLVGNVSVGKTCIVQVATTGKFDKDTTSTNCASYSAKTEVIEDHTVRLQIWDTAGQEKYRGMTPMYYHNAQIAIIVYSVLDRESFDGVDTWNNSLKNNASADIVKFLVGNKVDLENDRQVSNEEGNEKARAIGAEFYEVSAKTGFGIEDLFGLIPRTYFEKIPQIQKPTTTVEVNDESTKKKSGKNCC